VKCLLSLCCKYGEELEGEQEDGVKEGKLEVVQIGHKDKVDCKSVICKSEITSMDIVEERWLGY
jgi:hypothetical protein